MKRGIKNSREDVLIKPYRRAGNTTRIIDNAIQILFDEGAVFVQDHYQSSDNNYPTRLLFDGVMRRLQNEHQGLVDELIINKDKFIIEIKGFQKTIEERKVSKTQVELAYNHNINNKLFK